MALTTILLAIPLLGVLVLLFWTREAAQSQVKWVAFGFSIATFVASLLMWNRFDPTLSGYQMTQSWDWLPLLGIKVHWGVDGISMLLVLLTTFIMPLAILSSFGSGIFAERGRERLYYLFMLLLEFAMLGVFVTLDLIIFYVFWELTLVPMYFLIGIWGAEQRIYAAVKFFLYTMAGSIMMLLAILYVGLSAETFVLPEILAAQADGRVQFIYDGIFSTQSFLFLGFFIAFAIKVPIWPFHSWLPDAHVQAPAAGSVILAGILLKLGTYGIVRFCLPLFPQASVGWGPFIAALGVIGILYGAWVSYAQDDVKKLVAYSSVSHLGFVVVGIFALNSAGLQGATLQMVNHGISTGGLFLLVGMLYERRHTKAMAAYGGIWKVMPAFGGISLVIVLSSMGLPGLNGFVGEFTILLGSLGSQYLGFAFAFLATLGVILAAIYLLNMFQHVYLGELSEENANLAPMRWNEIAVLVPVVIMTLWIGLQPNTFFRLLDHSTGQLLEDAGYTGDARTAASLGVIPLAQASAIPLDERHTLLLD